MEKAEPCSTNGRRPREQNEKRRIQKMLWVYRWACKQELDLFEQEEDWRKIRRHISRHNWVRHTLVGVALGVVLYFGIGELLRFVPVSANTGENIQIGLVTYAAVLSIVWLERKKVREALRRRLIEIGVPVCMECGYCLRGLPGETERCPECGTIITPDVKALIIEVAARE